MTTASLPTTFRSQPAPNDTPFERLGRYPGIRRTMRQLFARIVDDPDPAPVLGRDDFEHHVGKMSTVGRKQSV